MLNKQQPEKKAREAATQESTIANERDALTNLHPAEPFGEAFASLATNMGKSFNGETDDWHVRPCVTNRSSMSTGILLCPDVAESRQAPKASIRRNRLINAPATFLHFNKCQSLPELAAGQIVTLSASGALD